MEASPGGGEAAAVAAIIVHINSELGKADELTDAKFQELLVSHGVFGQNLAHDLHRHLLWCNHPA